MATPFAPIKVSTFEQILDHNNPTDKRTFQQRYFINNQFTKQSPSPVLFYICGEATCSANHLQGSVATAARELGATLVALEHRYYGHSQPFDQLTTENMQYLTTDFALKDLAHFQESHKNQPGFDGPWIAVGGSYPGSLSAYYRQRYPNNVVGALASSAPVQARENFEEYDHHVFKVAGKECVANIRNVVDEIESAIENNPTRFAEIKSLFKASDVEDEVDFLYLIADLSALAIQYGYKEQFCDMISGKSKKGPMSHMEGYAKFAQMIYLSWGISPMNFVAQGATDLNPNSYVNGFGMRQWFYQSCTEYGYWQNAFHDPAESSRSSRIDSSYHNKLCSRLYGITKPVNEGIINKGFYSPLLDHSTSNIFYTNGSTDPWSNLSIMTSLGNAGNPHTESFVIENSAHCDDLRRPSATDSIPLKHSRSRFIHLAKEWIKTF